METERVSDKGKSFTILAEYYIDEELISYVVQNKYGKIMEIPKEVLAKWN